MSTGSEKRFSGPDIWFSVFLLTIIGVVSKGIGFVRELIIAAAFGVSPVMDAYVVASTIPEICSVLFTTAITAGFVPIYNGYVSRGELDEGQRFGSAAFLLLTATGVIMSVIGMIGADVVIRVLAPGFAGTQQELAILLTGLMMPTLLASVLRGHFIALQQATRRFVLPGLIPIIQSVVIIGGVMIFVPRHGVVALAAAYTAAAFIILMIQFPGLLKTGFRLTFPLRIWHDGLWAALALIGPILVSSIMSYIGVLINRSMGSGLEAGSIAVLAYGERLTGVFFTLLITPMVTVLYTELSREAALGQTQEFCRRILATVSRAVFLMLPVALTLMLLSVPVVTTLFKRGQFDATAVRHTANALVVLAPSVIGIGLQMVMQQAFLALRQARITMVAVGVAVILQVIVNFALIDRWQVLGLAAGRTVAAWTGAIVLIGVFYWRNRDADWGWLLQALRRIAVAAVFMAGAVWASWMVIPKGLPMWLSTSVVCGAGGLVYLVAGWYMGVAEVHVILERAGRWLAKKRGR